MKWGKVAQLRNIKNWLENYEEEGLLYGRPENVNDKLIRKQEQKLRANNFEPPNNIENLIDELDNLVLEYFNGVSINEIQALWLNLRPRLTQIFDEKLVLPEQIVEDSKDIKT